MVRKKSHRVQWGFGSLQGCSSLHQRWCALSLSSLLHPPLQPTCSRDQSQSVPNLCSSVAAGGDSTCASFPVHPFPSLPINHLRSSNKSKFSRKNMMPPLPVLWPQIFFESHLPVCFGSAHRQALCLRQIISSGFGACAGTETCHLHSAGPRACGQFLQKSMADPSLEACVWLSVKYFN